MMDRRRVLKGVAAAGASALGGLAPRAAMAEPPPETTRLRLVRTGSTCQAPQYIADELLRLEGFTEIQYVEGGEGQGLAIAKLIATGTADLTMNFVGPLLLRIDAGDPIVLLAGGHVGCFELVGTDRLRTVGDLKGKTVALSERITSDAFFSALVGYVGLDPSRDIQVVIHPPAEAKRLLAAGRIDGLLAFPPWTQEMRAEKVGRVLVNSALDRPWSGYFCCLLASNREFVRRHPVATKRAMRAILKAADLCAAEPDRAARALVDRGFARRLDQAAQLMRDLPYGQWRQFDPEDTVRFYALRLREAGRIRSAPQKLIAQGTDWRILGELRRELKA